MNDPNDTDHDRALLDDLESEFLELAMAGDIQAIGYAMTESQAFNDWVQPIIMGLLMEAGPDANNGFLASWAKVARKTLAETLAQHVAPLWALAELPKRVAATEEMVAEWAEEAA